MTVFAQVVNGVVTVLSYATSPGSSWISAPDGTQVGALYDGTTWTAPKPQTVPAPVFLARFPAGVLDTLAATPATLVPMLLVAAGGTVDLTSTAVQATVNALVPTFLTAPQAAAILDH